MPREEHPTQDSAKHTPGPWMVGLDYEEEGEREITIGLSSPAGFLTVAVAIGGLVAQDANARLIAAAPELLQALRRAALALAFASESSPAMQDDHVAALAAIAKATGATP